MKVNDEETLMLLEKGGAQTEGDTFAKIHSAMAQRALQTASHRIVLANRDGQRNLVLEKNRI